MRIFTEKPLKEFAECHPEAKSAIQDRIRKEKKAKWMIFADVKQTFLSAIEGWAAA